MKQNLNMYKIKQNSFRNKYASDCITILYFYIRVRGFFLRALSMGTYQNSILFSILSSVSIGHLNFVNCSITVFSSRMSAARKVLGVV